MDAWRTFEDDVAAALAALPPEHFLVLMTGPPPPRRLFRRAAQPLYVQFRHADGRLLGECRALTDAQVQAVRALGWSSPGTVPYWLSPGSVNHWGEWPDSAPADAARLAVGGLQALGVTDPAQVVREQGR